MALLNFKKGLFSGLATAGMSEGTVYITTDEKAMYVDISDTERIRIGQIVELTKEKWEAQKPPYSTEVFYYITDLNALVKYNGTNWIQINSTEALSSRISALEKTINGDDQTDGLVETVGGLSTKLNAAEGNITTLQGQVKTLQDTRLTDVTVNGTSVVEGTVAKITQGALATKDKAGLADLGDDVTQKFGGYDTAISNLATKTELNKAKSDLNELISANTESISTNAGNITTNANNITEINNKIGTGFSSTNTVKKAIDDLSDRVTTNETEISGLKTANTGITGRLDKLEAKDKTIEGNISTINETLEAHDGRITTAQNRANKGVEDAAAAQTTANQAKSTAEGNATAISGLQGRVKTIEDTYATDAEVEAIRSTLAEDIADNAETIGQHTQTLTDHNTRITAAQNKADGNATAIAGINTSIQTLTNNKVDKTTYNEKVSALESSIGENTTAASNAQKRADDAYAYADANKDLIDGHNTRISEVEGKLNQVTNVMDFIGVTTTDPSANEGKGTITINDSIVTNLHKGDVTIYGDKEYIYDGDKWSEFGDATGNASAITALTNRVAANEGNITTLQNEMDAVEETIEGHTTEIANRYTKTETDAKIAAALTWGTF